VISKYASEGSPTAWASIARNSFGIHGEEAFVDVEGLLTNILGLEVRRAALPSLAGLLLLRTPSLEGTILVEERDSWERQRFTLAHELKHILVDVGAGLIQSHEGILIHPDTAETLGHGMGSGAIGIEATADQFAGEFLIASAPFKAMVGRQSISVRAIAAVAGEFRVSVTAAVTKWVACAEGRCVLIEVREGKLYRFIASPAFAAQKNYDKWLELGEGIPTDTKVGRRIAGELELPLDSDDPMPVPARRWIRRSSFKGELMEDVLDVPVAGRLYTILWYPQDFVRTT